MPGNLPGGVSPDDLNKLTRNDEVMDIVANPKLQVGWCNRGRGGEGIACVTPAHWRVGQVVGQVVGGEGLHLMTSHVGGSCHDRS